MRLEDLEKKLYQKNPEGIPESPKKKESVISQQSADIQPAAAENDWIKEQPENNEKAFGFLTKFSGLSRWLFWILIGATVIIGGFVGYYFYHSSGNRNVVFSLNASSSIMLAVPFNLEFGLKNNSSDVLKDVKISMVLPEGAGFISQDVEKRVLDKNLGDLNSGDNLQDKINLIIFSSSQSVQQFEITVSYFNPALGSTVRFEQKKSINVAIDKPALTLDLTAPQKVLNNKSFEIEIHYQNISDIDFSNAELKLIYPDFFIFEKANIPPSVGTSIWKFGDLAKNSSQGSLIITGRVLSAEESFFDIKGSLSAEVMGQKYLISEKTVSSNIAASPLIMNLAVNDQVNYLASLGDTLRYKINYSNNSKIGLNDVVIKAKLVGSMFDFSTFQGNSFFDSKNATITWNAANTPSLRVLSSGANGSVEFTIRVKDNYPIKRVSDKNFILEVQGEISSPTIPDYVASDITIGLANLKTKVSGKVVIDTQLLFRDSNSGIINKGTLPPKVNVATNFTVHWLITNYSTDISGVEVKTFLQSGVRFTGQYKTNNTSSTLSYNERTQEVIWLIDKIPATKGVVSSPVEAIFQVEATPNITQVSQAMPILSETNLKALDEFSGINLISQDMILNTQLTDDPSVGSGQGTVMP